MPYPSFPGMPCTQAGGCVGNQQCVNADGGAASNGAWGRCDAPPGENQPCDIFTEQVFPGHACEASFYCSGGTSTCTARQGAGTPCTVNSQCQGYCADDGGCANARAIGATCNEPANCAGGTCFDGVCTIPACQPPPNVFDYDSLNLLDRILAWLFLG